MTVTVLCRRCRVTTPASRRTAQGRQTTAAATRAAAAATLPAAAHGPRASLTNPSPEPSSPRSVTTLNGRSSTVKAPRSSTLSRVTAPRPAPTTVVKGRVERTERTSAAPARTSASTGIRRKAPGVNRSGCAGATSANHTSAPASTVAATVAPVDLCRGLRVRRALARPVAPQPPHVATERLGEQGQGDQCQPHHVGVGQHAGDHRRERDADGGRHDLAPVAELQRPSQPGQQPARGAEGVAHDTGGQHPPADRRRGGHAEHEDEEGVDLAVEPPAELRDRAGAPGHDAVDGVEHERGDGEGDQHRTHLVPEQQLDRETGDRAAEQRPPEGHHVGRSDAVVTVLGQPADDEGGQHDGAPQRGAPAGTTEPHRRREPGQQGDEPGQAERQAGTGALCRRARQRPQDARSCRGLRREGQQVEVGDGDREATVGEVVVSAGEVGAGLLASSGRCSHAASTQPSSHSRSNAALPSPSRHGLGCTCTRAPRRTKARAAARTASGPSRVRPPVVRRWWSLNAARSSSSSGWCGVSRTSPVTDRVTSVGQPAATQVRTRWSSSSAVSMSSRAEAVTSDAPAKASGVKVGEVGEPGRDGHG